MPAHQPILVTRAPPPELRPFVHAPWAMESAPGDSHRTERVLPTGGTHIALRLSGDPFRLYDAPGDATGRDSGHVVVGGARVSPYVRDIGPAASVGALLRPGTAAHLLGTPAGELADRHTPLDALWGAAADGAIERMRAFPTAAERLDAFERILASRLPAVRGLHPAVAHALGRFASAARVGKVVEETGYSHRHFVGLFRDATGLAPKRFCRVLRFRRAVERLAVRPADSHARVALDADAVIRRAVGAGAAVELEPTDHFYGERSGAIRDPFGHRWTIGHRIEDVSAEEMQRRYAEACGPE